MRDFIRLMCNRVDALQLELFEMRGGFNKASPGIVDGGRDRSRLLATPDAEGVR